MKHVKGRIITALYHIYETPKVGDDIIIKTEDGEYILTRITNIYWDRLLPIKISYKGNTLHRSLDEIYLLTITWKDEDSVNCVNRLSKDDWKYVIENKLIGVESNKIRYRLQDRIAHIVKEEIYFFTTSEIEEIVKKAMRLSNTLSVNEFMESFKEGHFVTK